MRMQHYSIDSVASWFDNLIENMLGADISKRHLIQFKPLYGGDGSGAVCSLLQCANIRILLDCGIDQNIKPNDIYEIANELKLNGGIDAIIISHGDEQHAAGLPFMVSNQGLGVKIPILCTVPALKFSRMNLYDRGIHEFLENGGVDKEEGSEVDNQIQMDKYLSDVDDCFDCAITVKYSQSINLLDVYKKLKLYNPSIHDSKLFEILKLCAYNSGRTLGGAVWKITNGTTDVLYVMSPNMKRGVVLDGCGSMMNMWSNPSEPAPLLIMDASCYINSADTKSTSKVKSTIGTMGLKQRPKEDVVQTTLLPAILKTVRGAGGGDSGGNVIIPVDIDSRLVEVLYSLNKYWHDNKGAMHQYPLVLLSHMGAHVKSYAQCLLEWMSDSLCRGFYAGKGNPMNLHEVKLCNSVKELETRYGSSPKVVLVTDSSFDHGLSKELLLKWGGDPRCSVLFTDYPGAGTFSGQLVGLVEKGSRVIVNVNRLQRVLLSKEELRALEVIEEQKRQDAEEEEQRLKRERELVALTSGGSKKIRKRQRMMLLAQLRGADGQSQTDQSGQDELHMYDSDTDSEDEETDSEDEEYGVGLAVGDKRPRDGAKDPGLGIGTPALSRQVSGGNVVAGLSKYTISRHKMFDCKDDGSGTATSARTVSSSEYGTSIADLNFHLAVSSGGGAAFRRFQKAQQAAADTTTTSSYTATKLGNIQDEIVHSGSQANTSSNENRVPTKLIRTSSKIQFTCSFQMLYLESHALTGKADYKQLRTLLQHVRPKRVILMHGSCEQDLNYLQHHLQTYLSLVSVPSTMDTQIQSATEVSLFIPKLMENISISVSSNVMKLMIPNQLAASSQQITTVTGSRLSTSTSKTNQNQKETSCQVSSINGMIKEVVLSEYSLRKNDMKVVKLVDNKKPTSSVSTSVSTSGTHSQDLTVNKAFLNQMVPSVGLVAIGEVSMNTLKNKLESTGIHVEYKNLTNNGSILVCNNQIIITKVNAQDFILEGPLIPIYYEIRKILYGQYSFIY